MSALTNAGLFLINTLFDLYLFVLVVRLILAYSRADYFNPLTQIVIKVTQPIVAPVRRMVPNYRGIEFSTLIWILALEMIKFLLLGLISVGLPNVVGLAVLAIGDTLKTILSTFFYAIFIQAILSWFQQGYSPVHQLLNQLTAPIMRPLQRVIPTVSGFDITPIPALILLQLSIILLVNPLMRAGAGLAFG